MRLICENCDHGYDPKCELCPWCNTHNQMSHLSNGSSCMDTECYVDYWLCKFDTGETFQMFEGHPLDIDGLRRTLSRYTIVTFNGNNYDMPIIALALNGANNATLKQASDGIIVNGLRGWQIAEPLTWIDHIDMFDVAPGQSGLKEYGGKLHTRKMQDLPIAPSANIRWCDRVLLRDYCDNDLRITRELFETFPTQLKLREEIGAEYGIDVRSKSDAQIAESVMKKLIPFKIERPIVPPGSAFIYRAPAWLKFVNLKLLDLFARSPFTVTDTGAVSMSEELAGTIIRIGNSAYKMGIGGLHSTESSVAHYADDCYSLTDHDVASYYPSLIVETGIYPQQIGEAFREIYKDWRNRRMMAKNAGNKKVANSLKTLLNGTFGKLGSKWSIFYAPSEMIQVTVTGQLALLMLIEMLELSGISVISANTDGIVICCRCDMEWLRDSLIEWWEMSTGFETERADYRALYSRDVNNYVAIKLDGEAKLKGAYAPSEPGPSGWPNPTGQICATAIVEFLANGKSLEDTIRNCIDIRQFVYVRKVTGGGSYCANGILDKKTTITAMRAALGSESHTMSKPQLASEYEALRLRKLANAQYLGKAVRWYYAKDSNGCIATPGGSLVAKTSGCAPLMELPDSLPTDLDHEWYIREARSMLKDIGVNYVN